jgi:hypothetical protein
LCLTEEERGLLLLERFVGGQGAEDCGAAQPGSLMNQCDRALQFSFGRARVLKFTAREPNNPFGSNARARLARLSGTSLNHRSLRGPRPQRRGPRYNSRPQAFPQLSSGWTPTLDARALAAIGGPPKLPVDNAKFAIAAETTRKTTAPIQRYPELPRLDGPLWPQDRLRQSLVADLASPKGTRRNAAPDYR